MLTIFSVIGVSAACLGFMSAILLAEIPRTQATGSNVGDGPLLFAPLTNATGACFVGGALSSYECKVLGSRRNSKNHSIDANASFHYAFDGRYMELSPVSENDTDMHEMRNNSFTYVTWARGSNVTLLSLKVKSGRRPQYLNVSISSGKLKLPGYNNLRSPNVQGDLLYKLAIVFNVSHVSLHVDENVSSSSPTTGLVHLNRSHILRLAVGEPLVRTDNASHLSLFCSQVWNRALTTTEIAAKFRRCDMWRPLPVVTSSTTLSAYEKLLYQRCDRAVGIPAVVDTNTPTTATTVADTNTTTTATTVADTNTTTTATTVADTNTTTTATTANCDGAIAISVMLGILLVGAFIGHLVQLKTASGMGWNAFCTRKGPI